MMTNTVTDAATPRSAQPGAAPLAVPMSTRLWRLDWQGLLPWTLEVGDAARAGGADVTVEMGTTDEAVAFVAEHHPRLFGAAGGEQRFLASPMTDAKRRFCDEMDVLVMRARDASGTGRRVVGLFMSHPSDWSTYYIRTVAILPEYQGRGYYARFTANLYEPLRRAGVERVETEISVANTRLLRMFAGQGYVVTATSSTERWGAVVRLTKFLAADAEKVFLQQYTNLSELDGGLGNPRRTS
jgi:ribosomal protein S18 acetylase RimI-like enzyme